MTNRGEPFLTQDTEGLGTLRLHAWPDDDGFWWAGVWQPRLNGEHDLGMWIFRGVCATELRARDTAAIAAANAVRHVEAWNRAWRTAYDALKAVEDSKPHWATR